jgi:hypothetical protein
MRGIAFAVQPGGISTANPTLYYTYLYLLGNAPQHAIMQGVN